NPSRDQSESGSSTPSQLGRGDHRQESHPEPGAVGTCLELQTHALGAIVESPMSPQVLIVIDGPKEVIWPVWIVRPLRELRSISVGGEVPVEGSRCEVVHDQRADGRTSDPDLATILAGGPYDRFSGDLRSVDRWDRLRLLRQARLDPAELWRVQGRQLHHRDAHPAATVEQLATNGFRESLNRMFGSAVGGLQGNAAIGKRRADLDNHAAVARQHVLEGAERSVDHTQIGHFRSEEHTSELQSPYDLVCRLLLEKKKT